MAMEAQKPIRGLVQSSNTEDWCSKSGVGGGSSKGKSKRNSVRQIDRTLN